MMSSTFLLFSLLSFSLQTLAADTPGKCYAPNGALTQFTGGPLQIPLHPCPAGVDGFATCCAEGDTCSPDRLCYNAGGNNVWRNFCTDSSWKSGSCSPLCRGTDEYDSGPVQVTPCQDGMMCCGSNNTQCCNAHQGSYAFDPVPINATSDTTPPPYPSSTASSSSSISGGAIAGIVVGVIAILLLSAVLILLCLRFRADRRRPKTVTKEIDMPDVRQHIVSPTTTVNTAPSLRTQPSVRSNHPQAQVYQSPVDRDRPLPAIPRMPSAVHELGDGQGVSRFEVSGHSVWGDKK